MPEHPFLCCGEGSWEGGDIGACGEKASLTNESHTCQCLATKLKTAALGQFSRDAFFFCLSESTLLSEAESTNLGRNFEQEGALGGCPCLSPSVYKLRNQGPEGKAQ